ncbi:hypothetical protein G3O08_03955 [Cryomorpha ignava]|uniref:Uncharacterized protein n=1 Tax=Cryomorpha ignava TaxID=101383 RepID=A0A7K3WLY6_9FLAO|nr:hypothetical protein [Cryomorpha ignava]NEN22659.1 hypothetical protein [Cryomorpha ignava]
MKTLSLFFALILTLGVYGQDTPDPAVLKSEIKGLEKVVKEQEKDIAKLEKDLAKIRPDSEQAMRDAKNITDMRDRKKAEFESFEFDKKKAELKALKKESKTTAKDLSKTTKAKEKLKSKINELDRESEVLTKSVSTKEATVSDLNSKVSAYDTDEQKRMRTAQKSKEPQDSLLLANASRFDSHKAQLNDSQKDLSKETKSLTKIDSNLRDAKTDLAQHEDREILLSNASEKLKTDVAEKSAILDSMNSKAVEKELTDLQKKASAAQTTYENLNNTLEQQQKVINEKHDVLEAKKQEIREKQSVLDKL